MRHRRARSAASLQQLWTRLPPSCGPNAALWIASLAGGRHSRPSRTRQRRRSRRAMRRPGRMPRARLLLHRQQRLMPATGTPAARQPRPELQSATQSPTLARPPQQRSEAGPRPGPRRCYWTRRGELVASLRRSSWPGLRLSCGTLARRLRRRQSAAASGRGRLPPQLLWVRWCTSLPPPERPSRRRQSEPGTPLVAAPNRTHQSAACLPELPKLRHATLSPPRAHSLTLNAPPSLLPVCPVP
mmetsp:Transcript_20295/g.77934  ORF Transcript_20295/g.77934 Transcript_20295/m.77934 type:complete len:243 (-) Transcript_20295:1115-1843(-)